MFWLWFQITLLFCEFIFPRNIFDINFCLDFIVQAFAKWKIRIFNQYKVGFLIRNHDFFSLC